MHNDVISRRHFARVRIKVFPFDLGRVFPTHPHFVGIRVESVDDIIDCSENLHFWAGLGFPSLRPGILVGWLYRRRGRSELFGF